jgi:hypothetical protein
MSVLQKLAVTGSIVALAGIGVYEAREASQLRAQVRVLETQLAAMEPPDRQSPGQALPPLAVGAFVPGDQSVGDRAAANLNFPGTTQPSPSALAGLTPQSFAAQARQTAAQMQEEQRRFLAAHGSGVGGSGMGATGLPEAGALGPATLSTKSVNGSTVIVYRGREFPVGRTQGMVSTRAASIQGTDYAAAFDDKRVIWESVPGAAERLK